MATSPEILVSDQSEGSHGLDLAWLRAWTADALERALNLSRQPSVLATGLPTIEVTLVDDEAITRVHRDFMGLAEPTDVITFHHGEILISVETAQRQAVDYERSVRDEVALYVVHGLLHLAGYEDKSPDDFERMASLQERLLGEGLESLA